MMSLGKGSVVVLLRRVCLSPKVSSVIGPCWEPRVSPEGLTARPISELMSPGGLACVGPAVSGLSGWPLVLGRPRWCEQFLC